MACFRGFVKVTITCDKYWGIFDSRTGPLFPTKPKHNNYQWNIRNKNEPLKIKQRLYHSLPHFVFQIGNYIIRDL